MICWGQDIFRPLPAGSYRFVEVGLGDICGIRRDTGQIQCAEYDHGVPPDGEFKSLSLGEDDSCAIRLDETVTCWRRYAYEAHTPIEGTFSELVMRDNFNCGLHTDGEVACWGRKEHYRCGGTDDSVLCRGWGDQPLPEGPFTKIDASPTVYYDYGRLNYPEPICAVRADGDFVCWQDAEAIPAPPAGLFRAIDSGTYRSCAVGVGHEVTCWGSRASGWTVPAGPFESVSVGDYHACGLRPGGDAECWGRDTQGETAAPGGVFIAIDAGVNLSCGLRPGGDAECWGHDAWWLHHPPPGPFTSISVGDGSVCGVRAGGELDCWGRRREGPIPDGRFKSFSLNDHACGLRLDGTLVCADKPTNPDKPTNRENYKFYESAYSVFIPDVADRAPQGVFADFSGWGEHACGLRLSGTVDCWDAVGDWGATSPAGRFTAISAGRSSGCGIRPDRTLECWSVWEPPGWGGPDPDEALGATLTTTSTTTTTTTADQPAEPPIRGIPVGLEWVQEEPPAGRFTTIDSGENHTCGLTRTGSAYCWGERATARSGPFTTIRVGGDHDCDWDYRACSPIACGIRPGGEPYCWGANDLLTAPQAKRLPTPSETVTALDIGFSVCAARSSGGANCTDRETPSRKDELRQFPTSGEYGRISVGYGLILPRPRDDPGTVASSGAVAGSSRAPSYPDGYQHVCALRSDGEITCWGSNVYSQAVTPPPWLGLAPYRDVAAGFTHTCALDHAGEAICWGDNRHGQLDAPDGAFERISAGMWHTCALRADGEITCWGNGAAGYGKDQYDKPPEGTPTQPPPGPFVEVSAGQWHTCGLRADGTVACWYSY